MAGLPADPEAALRELRARMATLSPAESAVPRLRAARLLEGLGRRDDAQFEYLGLTGAESAEIAAGAWDSLARLARQGGDETEVIRAEVAALRGSPPAERGPREAALAASISRLDAGALRRASRLAAGTPAAPVFEKQLAARGDGEEWVVAVLIPQSGRFENFGRAFRQGAELALADHTASRPGGRTVRPVFEDTAGDLAAATSATRRVILERNAVVILGPLLSLPALASGALADAFGIPLVAPTATDPAIRQVGRHVLTLDPPPAELTDPLAEIAIEMLGARRFGALVPRDPTAEAREAAFRAAVESRGGEFAFSVAYDPGERDFRKLLELLEQANLDAVYVPADAPDLEALVPQLEFYEFAPRLLGNGGWTSSRVFHPGTRSLEGTVLAVQVADDPGSEFAQHMKQGLELSEQMEPTRFHLAGYRAMSSVLFAFDHGATDPEALGEMLRLRPLWPERPAGEEVHLLTIRDGALVAATPETLTPSPAVPDSSAAPADPAGE